MCDSCGCVSNNVVSITVPGKHSVEADHHHHGHTPGRILEVQENVLAKNDLTARHNRDFLQKKRIFAINLLSSPGSGKTTLLEHTVGLLKNEMHMAVIEGDQQTLLDAERIKATGADVVQVNTGTGCHLDAEMIHHAFHQLHIPDDSLLFIENVGNLVCPALFDLGEQAKVVIISVTEGEDKPLKYPYIFKEANLCIITKTDLLPYLDFDLPQCKKYALTVNPDLTILEVSARTGAGMAGWCAWLRQTKERTFR